MRLIHGSGQRLARKVRRIVRLSFPLSLRKKVNPVLIPWNVGAAFDWTEDVFFAYPLAHRVFNPCPQYIALYDFYHANKKVQREMLSKHFLVPEIGKPPYVVRPLRHERGEGFEIATTLPSKTREATHYWSSLWHRTCEYRVFFVRGKKVLTLLKRVPEGTRQDIPWSHGVSSFVTVHDENHDRLRHTKFYEKAEGFFKAYPFNLVAVDVLYHDCSHRVVEVNFSPNIEIEDNLETLAQSLATPFLYDKHRLAAA